jgi:hypothetical protein
MFQPADQVAPARSFVSGIDERAQRDPLRGSDASGPSRPTPKADFI